MVAYLPYQTRVVARRVLVHGEAVRLPKDALGLRVRSGRAWLSVGGEDFILGRRDEVRLGSDEPKGDFGVISAVGRVPLLIEILGARQTDRRARSILGQRS